MNFHLDRATTQLTSYNLQIENVIRRPNRRGYSTWWIWYTLHCTCACIQKRRHKAKTINARLYIYIWEFGAKGPDQKKLLALLAFLYYGSSKFFIYLLTYFYKKINCNLLKTCFLKEILLNLWISSSVGFRDLELY